MNTIEQVVGILPQGVATLTADQLACRWQISAKTIHRHVRAGTFPLRPLLPDARALRFSLAAVECHERAEDTINQTRTRQAL